MIRILTILVFVQGLLIDINAQSDFKNRHIYGLISEFYYLDILSDMQYSLKVGMYLDRYVIGDYQIAGDTLEIISFNFLKSEHELFENEKLWVQKGLSRFLIKDSLLIPISYRDLIPFSRSMQRDSTIVKEYLQNDGHVYCKLTFRADSTFRYSTGSDRDRHSIKGIWKQERNIIWLFPDDSDNLLHWICTNNKLIIFENYLIGKTYDKADEVTEYQYLIGVKPAANNMYK